MRNGSAPSPACLFDTGTGFAAIRPVVEEITSLPLIVVNSHYHFDHVGGNREFPAVSIHPAGVDKIYTDFDASVAACLRFLRVLRVLHTPGHGPDGISLLDEANGLLLTADAFNLGLVYCHFQDSDLAVLTGTAAQLERIDLSATEPGADILGQPCLTVSFDHFMITLPDPEHPAHIG